MHLAIYVENYHRVYVDICGTQQQCMTLHQNRHTVCVMPDENHSACDAVSKQL